MRSISAGAARCRKCVQGPTEGPGPRVSGGLRCWGLIIFRDETFEPHPAPRFLVVDLRCPKIKVGWLGGGALRGGAMCGRVRGGAALCAMGPGRCPPPFRPCRARLAGQMARPEWRRGAGGGLQLGAAVFRKECGLPISSAREGGLVSTPAPGSVAAGGPAHGVLVAGPAGPGRSLGGGGIGRESFFAN